MIDDPPNDFEYRVRFWANGLSDIGRKTVASLSMISALEPPPAPAPDQVLAEKRRLRRAQLRLAFEEILRSMSPEQRRAVARAFGVKPPVIRRLSWRTRLLAWLRYRPTSWPVARVLRRRRRA